MDQALRLSWGGIDPEEIQALIDASLEPVSEALDLKRNVADSYDKTEIDTKLALYRTIADSYSKAQIDAKFPTITGLAVYNFSIAVGSSIRVIYGAFPFSFFVIYTSGTKRVFSLRHSEENGNIVADQILSSNLSTTWSSGESWIGSNILQLNSFNKACNATIIGLRNITNVVII